MPRWKAAGFEIDIREILRDGSIIEVILLKDRETWGRTLTLREYQEWHNLDEYLKETGASTRDRVLAAIGEFPGGTRMLIHALTQIPPRTIGFRLSQLSKEGLIENIPWRRVTIIGKPLEIYSTTPLGEKLWQLKPKGEEAYKKLKEKAPKPLIGIPPTKLEAPPTKEEKRRFRQRLFPDLPT